MDKEMLMFGNIEIEKKTNLIAIKRLMKSKLELVRLVFQKI